MTPTRSLASRFPAVPLKDIPAWLMSFSAVCGVYVITTRRLRPLYVGQSSNLWSRLYEHRSCFRWRGRLGLRVLWIQVVESDLNAYEGALIRHLRPSENVGSPVGGSRDMEVLSDVGLIPDTKRSHVAPSTHSLAPTQELRTGAGAGKEWQ